MPAHPDPFASPLQPLAESIGARLRSLGIKLTLGGEPTYVPDQPDGLEWSVAAVGPTKLRYAYELAAKLIERYLPGAATIYSPGKRYPGEVNPRWVVNVLANRDGRPITPPTAPGARRIPPARLLEIVQAGVTKTLKIPAENWANAQDPTDRAPASGRAAARPQRQTLAQRTLAVAQRPQNTAPHQRRGARRPAPPAGRPSPPRPCAARSRSKRRRTACIFSSPRCCKLPAANCSICWPGS